ncbi:hypothetical protein LEMLEM_LOCUS8170 [Lemmus lemmus]
MFSFAASLLSSHCLESRLGTDSTPELKESILGRSHMYVKSVGRPSTRNEAQVDISGATLERSLISCPKRSEGGVGSPRTGVADVCELPRWFREPNLGPLQEQVLLHTEPCLHPLFILKLYSDRETPVWVPSRLTRTVENQEDRGDDTPLDAGVEQTTPKPSGTEMENPVCLP